MFATAFEMCNQPISALVVVCGRVFVSKPLLRQGWTILVTLKCIELLWAMMIVFLQNQIFSFSNSFWIRQSEDFRFVWLELVHTFALAGLTGRFVELLLSARSSQYCIFKMVSQTHNPTFTCNWSFFIYLFLYLLVVWVQFHLLFLVLSLTVPWPLYDISHHFFIFFYIFVNWYKIVHPKAGCLLCEPISLFCKL